MSEPKKFVCRCLCCGEEVVHELLTPGVVYCPNCLITLSKPDGYEEVKDYGDYRCD